MNRRFISLTLLLAMLLAMAVPAAQAARTPETPWSGGGRNPLYSDVPDLPGGEAPGRDGQSLQTAGTRAAVYVTPRQAADQLRQAMVARQSDLTLYIYAEDSWIWEMGADWFDSYVFPLAISQELAQGIYDGDYLRWSWAKYDWVRTGDGGYYTFQVAIRYYTTFQEEQQLAGRVEQLTEALGLASMTPYEAYTTLYAFVVGLVTYDEDTLEKIGRNEGSAEDYKIFTAYGALFQQRAVCQGIASLFYALCRQAGLPVRTVTSLDHAWNIVYLRGVWFNLDATWECLSGGKYWKWYLRGSESFGGSHPAEERFRTAEFQSAYPISRYDYNPELPFVDVNRGSIFYDSIKRATELGLFHGTGTYTFAPELEINRAMLVTVLWRMEGSPAAGTAGFTDVPADAYYANAVAWAADQGIVGGIGNGLFDPEGLATREQLVTILHRYVSARGLETASKKSLESFSDQSAVSPWAREALEWAVGSGIMNGTSAVTLSPEGSASREQLSAFLIRLIDRYGFVVSDQ